MDFSKLFLLYNLTLAAFKLPREISCRNALNKGKRNLGQYLRQGNVDRFSSTRTLFTCGAKYTVRSLIKSGISELLVHES